MLRPLQVTGPCPSPSVPPAAQVIHVADAAGPQVTAIRVGRPHDRAVIGVPDREGIRQRVVDTGCPRASCMTWPSDRSWTAQLSY